MSFYTHVPKVIPRFPELRLFLKAAQGHFMESLIHLSRLWARPAALFMPAYTSSSVLEIWENGYWPCRLRLTKKKPGLKNAHISSSDLCAGRGNRNPVSTMARSRSATKLYPQNALVIVAPRNAFANHAVPPAGFEPTITVPKTVVISISPQGRRV